MRDDERQLRTLVSEWMEATRRGDVDTVLGLMTDDVVFLVAGRPPFGKAEFAAQSSPPAGKPAPKFDGQSEIQEIQVVGDWAFMRTRLTVTMTPAGGSESARRSGYTLTVFRRENGRWLLARDANLLVPDEKR
jgi:uncharacterized protein (TIGR02246 family)